MADKRVIEQTASTELYNDDWFLKDSVVEGTTKISGVKLKELLGADGTQALEEIANSIAEEYDSNQTYAYNSWVFHEETLYRCIGNNVTGTWNATKWQAKTIKQFIADSENLITGRLLQMFGEYLPISTLDPPSIEAISKGDIFIYQRTNKYKFYRAKADHPQGVTEFDIDDWDEFDTVADLIEDVTENAGQVQDVTVDGTSVVTDKVAEIEIPVKDVQVKTSATYDSVVDASGNAKIDLSSEIAYGEASGTIASFSDGGNNKPLKKLEVAIEPQQDLHGYDAPWAGGAGKNKYSGGNVTVNNTLFADISVSPIPAGTYTISVNLSNETTDDVRVAFRKADGTAISATGITYNASGRSVGVITTDETTERIYFYYGSTTSGTGTRTYTNIQIEQGTTATSYAPYSNICPISGHTEANVVVSPTTDAEDGITYNIQFKDGSNPLTVYGGTLDVTSGVLTVDRAIVTYDGSSSENWSSSEVRPSKFRHTVTLNNGQPNNVAILSNEFKGVPYNSRSYDITGIVWASGNDNQLLVMSDLNETAFKSLLSSNNLQVVYELATPQTIQLTPTQVKSLLGSNNVWADTGDINDCIYQRDINTTINDIIARIEALENA